MAEKAIRLGGESTADAIVSAVDAMYTEHTFAEADFALKHNEDEISVDTNFAAQNFWKEALIRFFNKKSVHSTWVFPLVNERLCSTILNYSTRNIYLSIKIKAENQ